MVGVFRRRAPYVYYQRRRVWPSGPDTSVRVAPPRRRPIQRREPEEPRVYYLRRPNPIGVSAPPVVTVAVPPPYRHPPRRAERAPHVYYQRHVQPLAAEEFVPGLALPPSAQRLRQIYGVYLQRVWNPYYQRRRMWFRLEIARPAQVADPVLTLLTIFQSDPPNTVKRKTQLNIERIAAHFDALHT